ncbi:hypothetical protein [Caballeronia sp. KNU42]
MHQKIVPLPSPSDQEFWQQLETALLSDDGAAAKAHLEAGFPIYVVEEDTPRNTVVKIFPEGDRQLVTFDQTGEHVISPWTEGPEHASACGILSQRQDVTHHHQ